MYSKIGYIYKITTPTGKLYIGKTGNLKNRIGSYRNAYKSNANTLIFNSIKKYGWETHIFEVISASSIDSLNELEISYIQKYNSFHNINSNGLNLTKGGDGAFGRIDSIETKNKRSKKHIGLKRSDKTKQLMSLAKKGCVSNRKGIFVSDETKRKVSLANTGKIKPGSFYKKTRQTLINKLIDIYGSILQIDPISNEIIKEWVELPKIISNQTNIAYASIQRALDKKYKTAGGFIWKYKKEK
jgi:group I intron endonuclease